jgi:hypothetical protein
VASDPELSKGLGTPNRELSTRNVQTQQMAIARRKRINSLLTNKKTTALHAGFGAVRPIKGGLRGYAAKKQDKKPGYCSFSLVVLVLAAIATICPTIYLNVELTFNNSSNVSSWREAVFKSDPRVRTEAYCRLLSIPLCCACVNLVVQHLRYTTFWWDKKDKKGGKKAWIDPIACPLMLIAALWNLRAACLIAIDSFPAAHIAYYLQSAIALTILLLYYSGLDRIDEVLKDMKKEQWELNNTIPVKKMQTLAHTITRMGDEDKDYAYTFFHTNTVPAEVLHYGWWCYYVFGKVLGALVALSVFMDMAQETTVRVLMGTLVVSAGTSTVLTLELGPNMLNLVRLSLAKPFYVGDLVTLNTNGSMDGATSIMGFVENITMMYVVIRNFEMKQTWISHAKFSQLIIQNWTRRPTKTVLLNMGISSRCPVAKVEELTGFGKRWIKASPEIQQKNYQKCNITKTSNGYNIEIIFFPEIGVSHRGIRQKFLVAFMHAAERLEIPWVPEQLMQNFSNEGFGLHTAASTVNLDDLLPDPNDLLKKADD